MHWLRTSDLRSARRLPCRSTSGGRSTQAATAISPKAGWGSRSGADPGSIGGERPSRAGISPAPRTHRRASGPRAVPDVPRGTRSTPPGEGRASRRRPVAPRAPFSGHGRGVGRPSGPCEAAPAHRTQPTASAKRRSRASPSLRARWPRRREPAPPPSREIQKRDSPDARTCTDIAPSGDREALHSARATAQRRRVRARSSIAETERGSMAEANRELRARCVRHPREAPIAGRATDLRLRRPSRVQHPPRPAPGLTPRRWRRAASRVSRQTICVARALRPRVPRPASAQRRHGPPRSEPAPPPASPATRRHRGHGTLTPPRSPLSSAVVGQGPDLRDGFSGRLHRRADRAAGAGPGPPGSLPCDSRRSTWNIAFRNEAPSRRGRPHPRVRELLGGLMQDRPPRTRVLLPGPVDLLSMPARR